MRTTQPACIYLTATEPPQTSCAEPKTVRVQYFPIDDSAAASGRREKALYQAHSTACVFAVSVGANLFGILAGHRSAANQHLHLIAHARILKRGDGCLHGRHGHGEQRRHADNVWVALPDCGNKTLRRDICAEIDHFESAALKHRRYNVLADIVQVALYGSDDHAHGHPLP